jgi:hypothetical protein
MAKVMKKTGTTAGSNNPPLAPSCENCIRCRPPIRGRFLGCRARRRSGLMPPRSTT